MDFNRNEGSYGLIYGCRDVYSLLDKARQGRFKSYFGTIAFVYNGYLYVIRDDGADDPDADRNMQALKSIPKKQLLFENIDYISIDPREGSVFIGL